MREFLICNGTIVNADGIQNVSIHVKNEKIMDLLPPGNIPNGIECVDALGCFIFPGGIDPHVHFALPTAAGPSSDDFISGSKAALTGGTTTILDFITPEKYTSCLKAVRARLDEASNCLCDYSLHMSPTWWGPSVDEEIHDTIEIFDISSFKVYLAYKKNVGIDDAELLQVMTSVFENKGILMVHAEDGTVIDFLCDQLIENGMIQARYHSVSRPWQAEELAVRKVICYAEVTGCPVYFVHISSRHSLKLIAEAQSRGLKIFAETCPHYLVLDETVYHKEGFEAAKYVFSPPVRKTEDQDALWQAIKDGTIQSVGSDHCPFNFIQKQAGINDFTKIPNGAGGVEHRLQLLYSYGVKTGKIDLQQMVNIFATQPAQIFGLSHRKGKIKTGLDADLVLFDPNATGIISAKTHAQNCDFNVFEGSKTEGEIKQVFLRGKMVYHNKQGILQESCGQFIPREKLFF